MTATTGYAPIDRILALARERGLNVEIKENDDRSFVIARVNNHGLAGKNRLNEAQVTMYVSFAASKRGRWYGGYYTPVLGEGAEFSWRSDVAAGISRARLSVELLYLLAEHRKDGS